MSTPFEGPKRDTGQDVVKMSLEDLGAPQSELDTLRAQLKPVKTTESTAGIDEFVKKVEVKVDTEARVEVGDLLANLPAFTVGDISPDTRTAKERSDDAGFINLKDIPS